MISLFITVGLRRQLGYRPRLCRGAASTASRSPTVEPCLVLLYSLNLSCPPKGKTNSDFSALLIRRTCVSLSILHLLDHQHFDWLTAGHQLEAKLVQKGLLQGLRIMLPPIWLVPSEVDIKVIGHPGLINHGDFQVILKEGGQAGDRLIPTGEFAITRLGRATLSGARPYSFGIGALHAETENVRFPRFASGNDAELPLRFVLQGFSVSVRQTRDVVIPALWQFSRNNCSSRTLEFISSLDDALGGKPRPHFSNTCRSRSSIVHFAGQNCDLSGQLGQHRAIKSFNLPRISSVFSDFPDGDRSGPGGE